MNFKQFETKQKLRGGFYTALPIAAFLVKWIKASKPHSILEPSCGDGVFFDAIERENLSFAKSLTGFELDAAEAAKARARTKLNPKVFNTDFLAWFLSEESATPRFDAVVGNPPFIRYQYLPEGQQALAERVFKQLGLPFTKHTNAWVPFVLASTKLLRPGGRMAMVLPSEIFHIPHAQSLRRYLAEQCSRVLVYDPQEIWFDDTLQGTVLLLAEKKHDVCATSLGVAAVPVADRQTLFSNPETFFDKANYINGATIHGKWMPVFLSASERKLLADAKSRKDVKLFSDIASVDVGIVTGANRFFLVPDNVVKQFCLQRWAHPMFGRSDHVRGLIYSRADHRANKVGGLPANFLWFQAEDLHSYSTKVCQYLADGEKQQLHTRYKCRVRKPWYRVPSVYSAPVSMLKRAHHYPRLVLNTAGAYSTDTAYRIVPKNKHEASSLVFAFVNSLTCLLAEMEGRHYGGGVLELVPSEIERLLVPVVAAVTSSALVEADRNFRTSTDDSEFLRSHDARVLTNVGFTKPEQQSLHEAWLRLRDRRHRVPSVESAVKR